MGFDLLFRHGTLIDGSGEPPRNVDVGIADPPRRLTDA
jgi:N-acyl-D-aspartate/D-glutamate deacylase